MAGKRKPDDEEPSGYLTPDDEERFSLEDLLTAPWGFQLATASPIQRATCRVLEGLPLGELEWDSDVVEAFGGVVPRLLAPPQIMVLLCAIRCGKSLLSMAHAVFRSLRLDVSELKAGDGIRYSILSTNIDIARATFSHLVGALESTGYLSKLIRRVTADTVDLIHPSGRTVELKVVALARAGHTLVGRFSAGVCFDEAPRISSDAEHVQTLGESLKAVHGRMLPGSTILLPGSPHEPHGEVFDLYERHFGNPSAACVVVKARGPQMNPYWWTPERCERVRETDGDTYRTDVLADFRKGKASLFDLHDIDEATHALDFEPASKRKSGVEYVAALAPASVGTRWTLVVERARAAFIDAGGNPHPSRFACVEAVEWQPLDGAPLRPSTMLAEVKKVLANYDLSFVLVDDSVPEELIDQAFELGIALCKESLTPADLLEHLEEVRTLVEGGRYELPPVRALRSDLLTVKKEVSAAGQPSIRLPETTDGRRCDFIPLLARVRKFSSVDAAPDEREEDDMDRAIKRIDLQNARGGTDSSLHSVGGFRHAI